MRTFQHSLPTLLVSILLSVSQFAITEGIAQTVLYYRLTKAGTAKAYFKCSLRQSSADILMPNRTGTSKICLR